MNADGWGQVGAGQNDRRMSGADLQHNVQRKGAYEVPEVKRVKPTEMESGGPMKQQLHDEQERHTKALDHHKRHLERHHGRHYNSQYGHEGY